MMHERIEYMKWRLDDLGIAWRTWLCKFTNWMVSRYKWGKEALEMFGYSIRDCKIMYQSRRYWLLNDLKYENQEWFLEITLTGRLRFSIVEGHQETEVFAVPVRTFQQLKDIVRNLLSCQRLLPFGLNMCYMLTRLAFLEAEREIELEDEEDRKQLEGRRLLYTRSTFHELAHWRFVEERMDEDDEFDELSEEADKEELEYIKSMGIKDKIKILRRAVEMSRAAALD